jgi:hypothetical protein
MPAKVQTHVAGWKKVGRITPEDPSRLVFDIAITWAVGERVREAHPSTVHALHQAVHAISQAIFGAPLEFIPGTTAHQGVQALPKAQVCKRAGGCGPPPYPPPRPCPPPPTVAPCTLDTTSCGHLTRARASVPTDA